MKRWGFCIAHLKVFPLGVPVTAHLALHDPPCPFAVGTGSHEDLWTGFDARDYVGGTCSSARSRLRHGPGFTERHSVKCGGGKEPHRAVSLEPRRRRLFPGISTHHSSRSEGELIKLKHGIESCHSTTYKAHNSGKDDGTLYKDIR